MKNKNTSKYLKNICLTFGMILLGVILRLNRHFNVIDFQGRWILEHTVAFFFFPIFFITSFFILIEQVIKNKKYWLKTKYWVVVLSLCFNIFLIFTWEIDIQQLKTPYQILVDIIATILSFVYLWWDHKKNVKV